jgi:hypothetical protein
VARIEIGDIAPKQGVSGWTLTKSARLALTGAKNAHPKNISTCLFKGQFYNIK